MINNLKVGNWYSHIACRQFVRIYDIREITENDKIVCVVDYLPFGSNRTKYYTCSESEFNDLYVPCDKLPQKSEIWKTKADVAYKFKVLEVFDNNTVSMICIEPRNDGLSNISCNYSLKDVMDYFTYSPAELSIEADKISILDGAGKLRVSIGAFGKYADSGKRLAEDDKTESYISEILKRIEGTDKLRPGLIETPERVAKAFGHWFGGYQVNVADLFKAFEDGAENCDEMVVVRDIPFYSHCEHHMAAIIGTATVGYIPNGKIVGLSKLNRVVDAFARRLQVQERLTTQIAEAIQKHLQPLGVGVRIQARHMCMESRGVCQSGHSTVTTKLTGVMKTNADTRHEFLDNCK